jgi:prepilin-type N-terminal cleavage/methylation domain-containing protein
MKIRLDPGKLRNSQKGFTLIELLIVVAITGVLGTVLASALSQIILINASSTNHMQAIKQVENALHYINRDAQAAQSVSIYQREVNGQYTLKTGDPISFILTTPDDSTISDNLTLTWTDWSNDTNKVEYWITDKTLYKKFTYNAGKSSQSITQNSVAQYIISASGNWQTTLTTSKILSLNITAALPGFEASGETRTLRVIPRSVQ